MAEFSTVGSSIPKIDNWEKVTGKAKYTTDITLPRLLDGKILRSPYAHARIASIDVSKARQLAGVKAVVTGKDAPDGRLSYIQDRYILARDVVRFVGEAVAAVAAESREVAEQALELIEVNYEELPAVFDVEEAVKPEPAVVVHPGLNMEPLFKRYGRHYASICVPVHTERPNVFSYIKVRNGDTEKGFRESDLVLEGRYERQRMSHCAMEPHAAVVQPDPDGGLTVWATAQTPHQEKETLCRIFQLPSIKVRVIAPHQGGGFGGKVGGFVLPIPIVALLALKAGRPVKLVYTRDEVFIDGTTEIPAVVYIKDGVKKDGTLVAREIRVIFNSGAYSGITAGCAYLASYSAAGNYRAPNYKSDVYMVYTNEVPAGPFRGYGAIGPQWAIESHMDIVAARLGIDPVVMRLKNILKEGEKDPMGQTTCHTGLEDCIHQAADWIEWGKGPAPADGPWKKGKGIAASNNKTVGGGFASLVFIKVHHDGTIEVRYSAVDVGQGSGTALAQLAAAEFSTSIDKIKIVSADTAVTPYDFGTISNRVTWHAGHALLLACRDAKQQMFKRASAILNVSPENLEIKNGMICHKARMKVALPFSSLFSNPGMFLNETGEILGRGAYVAPVGMADPETGQGDRLIVSYAYGACGVEVAVNTRTGEVRVLRSGGCFDTGTPINPKICETQIEGGLVQGIGSTVYEDLVTSKGVIINPNFVDYKLPSINEAPVGNIKAMLAAPVPHPEGPYGAKGFTEGLLIAMAPAIANAVYDAVGVRIVDLPVTREKVLKGLKALGSLIP